MSAGDLSDDDIALLRDYYDVEPSASDEELRALWRRTALFSDWVTMSVMAIATGVAFWLISKDARTAVLFAGLNVAVWGVRDWLRPRTPNLDAIAKRAAKRRAAAAGGKGGPPPTSD